MLIKLHLSLLFRNLLLAEKDEVDHYGTLVDTLKEQVDVKPLMESEISWKIEWHVTKSSEEFDWKDGKSKVLRSLQ